MNVPFSLSLAGALERPAVVTEDRALRLFRFTAAALIAALCAKQSVQPAAERALIEAEVTANSLSRIVAAWLQELPSSAQWQLATACALALAVGLAPRLSASMLVIVLGASRAEGAASTDLSLAAFFALWLLVLPTGNAQRSPAKHLAAQIFLAHIALLYVSPALFTRFDADWRPWSVWGVLAAAIPGLMLLDRGGWPRVVAVCIQLVIHTVLARSGHVVAHALFASTTILSLSNLRRPVESSASQAAPASTFDGHAACAVALTCIALVTVGAQLRHASEQLAIAAELFRDLGGIADMYSLR